MSDLCERAQWRSELVGVIAVRIDDLEQISTAFGSEVARAVTETWRTGVRRHAPSNSFVAEDGPTGLLVGRARRVAAGGAAAGGGDLPRPLRRSRHGGGTAPVERRRRRRVIPVVGVGVALSDTIGYDAEVLAGVAREAATRAAIDVDTSVLIGEAE